MMGLIATITTAIVMLAGGPDIQQPELPERVDRAVPVITSHTETVPPSVETTTVQYTVWDRLAQCESNGDWSINTGNGFYGGLQFTLSSWQWVGGTGYPHHASKDEQIYRAELLLNRQGWGAWPACSRKLGLRP